MQVQAYHNKKGCCLSSHVAATGRLGRPWLNLPTFCGMRCGTGEHSQLA